MELTPIAFGVLLLGLGANAHADYAWELAGRVAESEQESPSATLESDEAALSAVYYFDAIDDADGPNALAAFLDPATQLAVAVNEAEQKRVTMLPVGPSGSTVLATESEATDYSINGRYLLPRSKWYAGGRYAVIDLEEPIDASIIASASDASALGLVGGKYFGPGATRLEFSVARSTAESEQTLRFCILQVLCSTRTTSLETTTDELRVDVMHVRRFRSATYALFAGAAESEARFVVRTPPITLPTPPLTPVIIGGGVALAEPIEIDPIRVYSVGAELFPIPTVGVRLDYARFDGQSSEDDAVSLGASWFFHRHVGLQLTVSRDDTDGGLPRTERATLRVIGRL